MIELITIFVFASMVLAAIFLKVPECPRELLGYSCRNKDCDHSDRAVSAAHRTLERNELMRRKTNEHTRTA